MELQIFSFRNKISSFPRWLRRRITQPALISWWKLPNTHTSSLITSRTNIFTYFFIHKGLRGCFLSFCGWACGSKTIADEGLTLANQIFNSFTVVTWRLSNCLNNFNNCLVLFALLQQKITISAIFESTVFTSNICRLLLWTKNNVKDKKWKRERSYCFLSHKLIFPNEKYYRRIQRTMIFVKTSPSHTTSMINLLIL